MRSISTLSEFLQRSKISKEEWQSSRLKWEELRSIEEDYLARFGSLEKTAALLANVIQSFEKVHSVRWRVKDVDHLLAKIVRKRIEGSDKYQNISTENYTEIVTDLIGIRAIHLFKADFVDIDGYLRSCLDFLETPVAYVREGDDEELNRQYEQMGLEVKNHPKGYRSIHYVATSRPFKKPTHVEIQVRTIFEEGWSEIDHTLRYPSYSDNVQVAYLLTILNRMAGSADELGGFVKVLAKELSDSKRELDEAISVRDQSVAKMEEALVQLEKERSGKGRAQINTVKDELEKIKKSSSSRAGVLGKEMLRWISENGITSNLNEPIKLHGWLDVPVVGSAIKKTSADPVRMRSDNSKRLTVGDLVEAGLTPEPKNNVEGTRLPSKTTVNELLDELNKPVRGDGLD